MNKDDQPIDPLALTINERTLWLLSRLQHVEQLLHGMGDVQKLVIGLVPFDAKQRATLRAGLTELAVSLPPGTLRTVPIWSALGLLDAAQGGPDGQVPE